MQSQPRIVFKYGQNLKTMDPYWYTCVEQTTAQEKHLLTKTRSELEPAAHDNRVIIAIDEANNKVVGCIVLWELTHDAYGDMWYELGTFFVIPEYRFHAQTNHIPIGDTLYRTLLKENTHRNILATTTNRSAIKTGKRNGMHMIRFEDLPFDIHQATCCCPEDKTRVKNNSFCKLKNQLCRVRVSYHTWVRMGHPELLATAI